LGSLEASSLGSKTSYPEGKVLHSRPSQRSSKDLQRAAEAVFYKSAGCHSCHPTNRNKALMGLQALLLWAWKIKCDKLLAISLRLFSRVFLCLSSLFLAPAYTGWSWKRHKGKDILDVVPLCESSPQKRSGMARVLRGSLSFTCTPTRSSAIGMSHTCHCLPKYSWYLFTDPEGWKAELAQMAGYVVRQFTCPKAVTHPTTNRAQCRATVLYRYTN